ncbi:hypothetical protein C8034_v006260 [Colletotrichum sidae]|uniref:Rhodopsin domain-containing protein n=1 Tax=Colletotrichum sidae TaxID=1347389 RepID=A0A4V3I362_9PEZI|nr:hypothetical protein C8034_v006260 [Colletotrichum sidae]
MQILFTTTPISYNWTFWDEQHSGTRGNVRLFSFINGGINIALDLWLFILPVTQLVTVSSCIRLETLAEFGLSRNPTYDLVGLSTWSLVELHLSVICACLPGMRLLFRRLSPALRRRRLPKDLTHNRPRTGRFIPRVLSRFVSLVTEPDDLDNRSIRGSVVTEVGTTRYWTPPAHRDHEVSGRAESAVQSMVERGKSDPSIPTSAGSV